MILPRVNVRRQAAWYKDGEPPDMSPVDAQVRPFERRPDAIMPGEACRPIAWAWLWVSKQVMGMLSWGAQWLLAVAT